ncbi:MAG TPA: hypothetical protein PKA90_08655 [Ignavibacteria bacterium]|nr:hypothetical protein [Ignavibacteria bacterium]HMR40489.1 hypothetical protein [Ignavibacteria bacterium]
MLKTSLIEILKTLSAEEIKKFDDFVSSPYFNKKTPVTKLWKTIKAYSPGFGSDRLDRKFIYSELFPGKEFNYGVMKNLIFELTRLAENFLITKSFEGNELTRKIELLYELQDRELIELYNSRFDNIEKNSLEMSFSRNMLREDFYYRMWKLYMNNWNFDNQFMHLKDFDKNINFSSDFFLAFTMIKAFIIYHNTEGQKITHNFSRESVSIEIFLNKLHENGIIDMVIHSMKVFSKDVSEVMNVYHKMFLSISDKNSIEKYFDFKSSLIDKEKLFSLNDLRGLYITLSNCLGHLNSKDINKSRECLEIYDYRINNDLIITNEEQVWDQEFVRFISVACSQEKIDSIENFIDKVSGRIQNNSKENLLNFAKAHICFIKKDYGKALELLALIKYDLFTMKFYVKNLQLKIFYELNDLNSFMLALDSYKHFLYKNKYVSEKMKISNKKFCDFIERLYEQKINYDEYKFSEIKKEILEDHGKDVVWIVRKADELENMKR